MLVPKVWKFIINEDIILGILNKIMVNGISNKKLFPNANSLGLALYPWLFFPNIINIGDSKGNINKISIMKLRLEIKLDWNPREE